MVFGLPVTTEEWRAYLSGYSADYLRTADEDTLAQLGEMHRQSEWLGFPAASEADIAAAERRLGVRLPPSYRHFLLVSNGWREMGRWVRLLRPAHEIGWFRDVEQETWEVFANDPMLEHLPDQALAERMRRSNERFARHIGRCLALSFSGDGDYWLLDPERVDAAGEWAAYTWSPASPLWEDQAHASFSALVASARAQLATSRARHGRPVDVPGARASGELTARGRRAILAGDADAAIAAFESAADRGDRLAPYLSALVRAFTEPRLAHNYMSRCVLGVPWVLDGVDERYLRAELIPLYIRLVHEYSTAHPGVDLRAVADFLPDVVEPVAADDGDLSPSAVVAAELGQLVVRAANFKPPVLPEPPAFAAALDESRQLALAGDHAAAWTVIKDALPRWQPDSPYRIVPAVLLTDPVLRATVTPDRAREVVAAPLGGRLPQVGPAHCLTLHDDGIAAPEDAEGRVLRSTEETT